MKDNQLLKQSSIDLTLTNFHAFNVYKKDGACFRVVYNYRSNNLHQQLMIKTGSYDQSFVDQREDIKALKLFSVTDKFFD